MTSANSPQRAPAQPARRLVYGHAEAHECLAFADADTAAEEAREIVAITSARTWGEARAVAVRHTWNPADPDYDDDADAHTDDTPFAIRQLDSVADGDWPAMVTTRALTLLPEDLRTRFGRTVDTHLNGDYLEIPLEVEADIVAALHERGFEVVRDDDLINTLDGLAVNA